jgi:hypothetical protein
MGHGVKIPGEQDVGGARRLHAQLEVAGTPQGGIISPCLANATLNGADFGERDRAFR